MGARSDKSHSAERKEATVSYNESQAGGIGRRGVLLGLAAAFSTISAPAFATAPAILKGAGNYRSVNLVNNRTQEWVRTVYWVEGEYIPEAMQSINVLLRDWRADEVTQIDPRTIDIISATHSLLDCSEPFEVVSGYRNAATNAQLRRRSRAVARKSYHILGMATDLKLKTRSVRQIAAAGKSLKAGGVGTYSRSQFVHLDSGPVRDWGR
ncbi:DUF882 domain-containing protein [Rhodobacteraceae bacterium NNCM2]|nr:DUF882 domain-containing protein [Coraliihabitans acroporae]